MKKILFLCFFFVLTFSCSGQKSKTIAVDGEFVEYNQGKVLYYQNQSESSEEYPLYNVKVLDLGTGVHKTIVSKTRYPKAVLLNNNELFYTTAHSIVYVNKQIQTNLYSTKGCFIDVGYDKSLNYLSYIEINPVQKEASICIVNFTTKEIIYKTNILLNQMELEGLDVISYWLDDCFVFSLQSGLYEISMNANPSLTKITDRLYTYAVYKDNLILFDLTDDDMTRGCFFDMHVKKINPSPNIQNVKELMPKCFDKRLYTIQQDGVYFPMYEGCGKSFIYNNIWSIVKRPILYQNKDNISILLDTTIRTRFIIEYKLKS